MMVQLNVKVPYHYREQLINEARDLKLSLNRHVVNGLVRVYPPQRR
jgi:predicted HicB family RNase H-like nuclease